MGIKIELIPYTVQIKFPVLKTRLLSAASVASMYEIMLIEKKAARISSIHPAAIETSAWCFIMLIVGKYERRL